MPEKDLQTRCCISGGGPAGIMLGYLLARAGIDVTVLEKWPDFFRDFRGDTIHPATMEIMRELGLLEEFLKLPHNETKQIAANVGGKTVVIADFSKLKSPTPFLGFMPQWDFLNFLADRGRKFPSFHLLMETEALGVTEENGQITGIRAKNKDGEFLIKAELVVGADGRHSTLREAAGMTPEELGAQIDVLWFRLSRQENHKAQSLGYIAPHHMMILIDRDSYWQCAFLIRKGDYERIKSEGLEKFRASVVKTTPILSESIHEISSWDNVKLLSVSVNRLKKWYRPGFICIGDAAHAMSPVGGVGINLAIADAVAAANILIPKFKTGEIKLSDLEAIQNRRMKPAKLIQRVQILIHKHVLEPALESSHPHVPALLRILNKLSWLQRWPAQLVGFGYRPEHI